MKTKAKGLCHLTYFTSLSLQEDGTFPEHYNFGFSTIFWLSTKYSPCVHQCEDHSDYSRIWHPLLAVYPDIKENLSVLLVTKVSPSVLLASSLFIGENQDAGIMVFLITPPSPHFSQITSHALEDPGTKSGPSCTHWPPCRKAKSQCCSKAKRGKVW